jgi:hypothetical protein
MQTLLKEGERPEPPRFQVVVIQQGDHLAYVFSLSADELMTYGIVERYGEDELGVQRKLDEDHALDIAQYMIQPGSSMLENIEGDLRGNWKVEDGYLVGDADARISLDNGQHRWYACQFLDPEERVRWRWAAVATMGLSVEERLANFLQQDEARTVDGRLSLAMRYALVCAPQIEGREPAMTDIERASYALVLHLNDDRDSPLLGQIQLEEQVKQPNERGHKEEGSGINAVPLFNAIKQLMGKSSPIFPLEAEERAKVIGSLIWAASEAWPKSWMKKDHILTTSRGLSAVLKLMVMTGSEFRVVVGNEFTFERMKHALLYAKSFKWHKNDCKNMSVNALAEELNKAIERGHKRDPLRMLRTDAA